MRLDKCLANSGFGSRAQVKKIIKKGSVTLAGEVITDPGYILSKEDLLGLAVEGKDVRVRQNIHLMMYKPSGVITAMGDERMSTIADLIDQKWLAGKIFPVGRLDRNTSGLLLLTNDGTLCHRLASPRWHIAKTYRATTQGRTFDASDIDNFASGLKLDGDILLKEAKLDIIGENEVDLTIYEGKYHQVKRMMLSTGRRVISLHRHRFGPLLLDDELEPGQYRELTAQEAKLLYKAVNL